MAFGAQGAGFQNPVVTKIIIIAPVSGEGIFIYSPTAGPGNLVASIAAQSGVDSFGNPYVGPGLYIQNSSSGFSLFAGLLAGLPELVFDTPNPSEAVSAFIDAGNAVSSATFSALQISSAKLSVAGHTDLSTLQLNSPPDDGSASANGNFNYFDPTGVEHTMGFYSAKGLITNAGVSSGVVPGTGTDSPLVPAVQEGWHPMALASGWTALAGHAVPSYKMMTEKNEVHICGFAQHAAFTGTVIITTLPVGYRPVNIQTVPNTGDAVNPAGQIAILTSGVVETSVFPVASSTQVSFNGTFPIDV